MDSLVKSSESFESLTRRVKERARREKLHRQIGALETKLAKLGEPLTMMKRDRAYRLNSKLKRLRAELAQRELFL
jgi:hypothetical protein